MTAEEEMDSHLAEEVAAMKAKEESALNAAREALKLVQGVAAALKDLKKAKLPAAIVAAPDEAIAKEEEIRTNVTIVEVWHTTALYSTG